MSKLLPNTFQHHNFYVDQLAYYLTPEEEKVLNRAVREILGWQDNIESRSTRIALSIFAEGRFKKGMPKTEEYRLSYGCGLSEPTIRKVLNSLDELGILKKVGKANNDGQCYTLQIDIDQINWDLLKKRREEWDQVNQTRTKKARGIVRQEGYCPTAPQGYCPTAPQGYCPTAPKKPKPKPKPNPKKPAAALPNGKGMKTLIKDRFCELTGLEFPNIKSTTRFWWGHIGEIERIFEGYEPEQVREGLKEIICYMQSNGIDIFSPKSIEGYCRKYAAQKKQNKQFGSNSYKNGKGPDVQVDSQGRTFIEI